jgi:CO dehydrogenase/acetyl-CoA synthase alpha subunit
MENMEQMLEPKKSMQEDIRNNQTKMGAETKTNQEMLARMETKVDVTQAEMKSIVNALQEKLNAWIANTREATKF